MDLDRKLFLSLFVIQVLASFLVLAGHYTAGVNSYIHATAWEIHFNQISRYGTVLLAMLTGFFTAHSFAAKKTSIKSYFSGKIQYIFIPFLLSGILYNWLLLGHLPRSIKEVIYILMGQTGQHLYFVFMLCQFYLFAYVFRNRITKKNMLGVLSIFLAIQYIFIKMNPSFMGLGVRHFLPTWIFTLYLGYALYVYRKTILQLMKRKKIVPILLTLAGFGSAIYFIVDPKIYTANHIRFVLSTFDLLLVTILVVSLFIDKVPIHFRKGLTFYVYLLHPVLIIYFNHFFIQQLKYEWLLVNKWLSFVYVIMIWLASLIVAYGITYLMDMLKKMKYKSIMN